MARNSPPGKHRRLRPDHRVAFRGAGVAAAGAVAILGPVFLLSSAPTTLGQEERGVSERGGEVLGFSVIPPLTSSAAATSPAGTLPAPAPTESASTVRPVPTSAPTASTAVAGKQDEPDPCGAPTTTAVEGASTTAEVSPSPSTTVALAPPVVDDPGSSGCPTTGTTSTTTPDAPPMQAETSSEYVKPSSALG